MEDSLFLKKDFWKKPETRLSVEEKVKVLMNPKIRGLVVEVIGSIIDFPLFTEFMTEKTYFEKILKDEEIDFLYDETYIAYMISKLP